MIQSGCYATAAAIAGYLCVQSSPVRVSSIDCAAVKAGLHAIAVEFDFTERRRSFRRVLDELGQLRPDPIG